MQAEPIREVRSCDEMSLTILKMANREKKLGNEHMRLRLVQGGLPSSASPTPRRLSTLAGLKRRNV